MLKTALIVGATGDIGKVIAKSLANAGYDLLLCGNKGKFDENLPCKMQLRFDVGQADQVKLALEGIKQKIDLLVCCAGIADNEKLLVDQDDQTISNIIQTNLLGTIYVNKYALPLIKKGGSIVNISSFLGVHGCSCEAVYSASKAGVIGLTKSLAKECGAFKVRVNSISPGYIQTKMNNEFSQDEMAQIAENTPVGRLGRPQDVASAVLFLAENSFVNGENIMVDGGLII